MQTHTKHLVCVYLSMDGTPALESLSHHQPPACLAAWLQPARSRHTHPLAKHTGRKESIFVLAQSTQTHTPDVLFSPATVNSGWLASPDKHTVLSTTGATHGMYRGWMTSPSRCFYLVIFLPLLTNGGLVFYVMVWGGMTKPVESKGL